jgi:hypothetical protein
MRICWLLRHHDGACDDLVSACVHWRCGTYTMSHDPPKNFFWRRSRGWRSQGWQSSSVRRGKGAPLSRRRDDKLAGSPPRPWPPRPEWRPATRMPPQCLWPAACPFSWPRPWLSMPLGAPRARTRSRLWLCGVWSCRRISHIGRDPSITGAGSVTGQTKPMHATVLLRCLQSFLSACDLLISSLPSKNSRTTMLLDQPF